MTPPPSNIKTHLEDINDKLASLQFDIEHKYHSAMEQYDLLDRKDKLILEKAELEAATKSGMNSITLRIQKALEDLEAEAVKLLSDYKRIRWNLKHQWRLPPEAIKILRMQERHIERRNELETALKIMEEFK